MGRRSAWPRPHRDVGRVDWSREPPAGAHGTLGVGHERTSSAARRAAAAALALVRCSRVVALASQASALTARFAVNEGETYTRWLRVSAGDGGWSPFFTPAVVVWDGGSIIAGHRATPGREFPVQTLTLVPDAVAVTCRPQEEHASPT